VQIEVFRWRLHSLVTDRSPLQPYMLSMGDILDKPDASPVESTRLTISIDLYEPGRGYDPYSNREDVAGHLRRLANLPADHDGGATVGWRLDAGTANFRQAILILERRAQATIEERTVLAKYFAALAAAAEDEETRWLLTAVSRLLLR